MGNRSKPQPPSTTQPAGSASAADKRNTLQLYANGEDHEIVEAKAAIRPSIRAGLTIQYWAAAPFHETDINYLVRELREQEEAASRGNLGRAEAMLVAQAHTLDTIFNALAQKARINIYNGNTFTAGETFLRLALKAQSQCRTTLETLAEIKNPRPVAFVKQQNIAAGPQQVNNGTATGDYRSSALARTGNIENQPNELLEQIPNEWMDSGAAPTAVGGNQNVETLGEVVGSTNAGR